MLFDSRIKADLETVGHGTIYNYLQKIQSSPERFHSRQPRIGCVMLSAATARRKLRFSAAATT